MPKRYIVLFFAAFMFLAIPIAIGGSLKDFETSSSSSSSSYGGCNHTDYYTPYYPEYYPYPYPSREQPKKTTLEEIEEQYTVRKVAAPTEAGAQGEAAPVKEEAKSPCASNSLVWPKMTCLKSLKKAGYNGIPTIKFYGGYQKLITDVQGYNFNIQAGHGLLGIETDYVHYFENDPKDKLFFVTPRVLIRIPTSSYLEFDAGIGATVMRGSRTNTGVNYGVTGYFYPIKYLILESKIYGTTFSEKKTMFDWDSALSFKYKMFGIRGGYRLMVTNGNKTLHGPEVGLFIQW